MLRASFEVFPILFCGCWPSWIHIENLPGSPSVQNVQRISVRTMLETRVQGFPVVVQIRLQLNLGLEAYRDWRVLSILFRGSSVTCCHWQLQYDLLVLGISYKVQINWKVIWEICPPYHYNLMGTTSMQATKKQNKQKPTLHSLPLLMYFCIPQIRIGPSTGWGLETDLMKGWSELEASGLV